MPHSVRSGYVHGLSRQRMRGGFTLIELLVVIAVLGILTSLLLPGLARARNSARIAQCASNLHQIGLALQMYEHDWGGLPGYFLNPRRDPYHQPSQAKDPLGAYNTNPDVYDCPAAAYRGQLNDYVYRGRLSLSHRDFRPRLAPDNVVAYCDNHVRYPMNPNRTTTGLYVVLRMSGAVQQVPVERAMIWGYRAGHWYHPPAPHIIGMSLPVVFPGEPWPPALEPWDSSS